LINISADTIKEVSFSNFNKILERYIENVDPTLEKSNISKRKLTELVNETIIEKIAKHYKVTKKLIKEFLQDFYEANRLRKKSCSLRQTDEVKKDVSGNLVPKLTLEQSSTPAQANKSKSITSTKQTIIPQDAFDEILNKAPENERFLFDPVLKEYLLNPSSKELINVNRILDRYHKLYVASTPTVKLIPYKRPKWLAPKQHLIADAVQKEKNNFIHGERQTGKDSAIAVGMFEGLITKKQQQPLFFMASKISTAEEIISKIINEDRFQYLQDHIHTRHKDYILFYCQDGGINRFQLIDTTEAAVKGITGNLWIDDIDTIIKNLKQDVITKAIMITRANPQIHWTFTSNMGKGSYISFLETIKDPQWDDRVSIFELQTGDVSHIIAEKDEFLFAIATALSGKGEAEAQLLNIYNKDGDTFDHISLKDAQDCYEYFMSQIVSTIAIEKCILSIDPSGLGHKVGWTVKAYGNDMVWELDSGEIALGEPDRSNEKWSIERMTTFFIKIAREHFVNYAIMESNTTGFTIYSTLKANGIKCKWRNFGGEGKSNSHSNKNALMRHFLDERQIVIKNPILISQLRIYNPDMNQASRKGDMADASIHCVWELVGGLNYLKNKLKEKKAKQLEETEQMGYS